MEQNELILKFTMSHLPNNNNLTFLITFFNCLSQAGGPDSSSNTSSCNSSTPSSPALCAPPATAHAHHTPHTPAHHNHNKQQFHFPGE